MSKYKSLWEYLSKIRENNVKLSFDDIKIILGFDIDHSFLTYKKELEEYGWCVKKISMKEKIISFERIN